MASRHQDTARELRRARSSTAENLVATIGRFAERLPALRRTAEHAKGTPDTYPFWM